MATDPDRTSHFPAIEKKHGQPMSYWFDQMDEIADRRYPEQIAYLRENHGFSQAHANALVMYCRGSASSRRFATVEDYLAPLDVATAATVRAVLATAAEGRGGLETVIAWNKPMLRLDGQYVLGVSAQSSYLLLEPFSTAVLHDFAPRLAGLTVNKKTFAVPVGWTPDAALLHDLVAARVAEITA